MADETTVIPPLRPPTTIDTFAALDIRAATILEAAPFPEARRPAYKLRLDLGPLGTRTSSAQITELYRPEDLVGRQVSCVANLPARQIGPVRSEVLVLGFLTPASVVLVGPDRPIPNGSRLA